MWQRRNPTGTSAPLFELHELSRENRYRNEAKIRGLCHNAYLGEDEVLCRVLGRYKVIADTRDAGLSSHLLMDGYWEMWLTEALAQHVKPGMSVVDVGANLGYFTLIMADLVGVSGRVHAFEPNERSFGALSKSVAMNGFDDRVILHDYGLGDVEEQQALIIPRKEPKNGYLVPLGEGEDGVAVDVRRMDACITHPVDVLKIDAEGSEQRIWSGMEGLLQREGAMTVFLEFASSRYLDPPNFLAQIRGFGFAIHQLTLDDGIVGVSDATILTHPPTEDIQLVLAR